MGAQLEEREEGDNEEGGGGRGRGRREKWEERKQKGLLIHGDTWPFAPYCKDSERSERREIEREEEGEGGGKREMKKTERNI